MKVILMMTVIGTIMIALGLLGLYINVSMRLQDIEDSVKEVKKNHSRTRQRVKDLEDQAKKEADQIEIVHKYDDSGAPQFGGF